MKVYLVRASLTVDAPAEVARASRHLSLKGRQVARAVGKSLAERGVSLDALYASPEFAAVQTAELLADRLDHLGEVRVLHGASSGLATRAAASVLTAAGESVAFVGEEPWLATLGAWLVGTPAFPPGKPAQASLVEDARPVWTLDPDTLSFLPLRTG